MEVWKIIFLSKWVICRFHVNLPECTFHDVPVGSSPFLRRQTAALLPTEMRTPTPECSTVQGVGKNPTVKQRSAFVQKKPTTVVDTMIGFRNGGSISGRVFFSSSAGLNSNLKVE